MKFGIKSAILLKKESVYHEKYLRTKVKSYEEKIITNFHVDKVPNKVLHVFTYHQY